MSVGLPAIEGKAGPGMWQLGISREVYDQPAVGYNCGVTLAKFGLVGNIRSFGWEPRGARRMRRNWSNWRGNIQAERSKTRGSTTMATG